MPNFLSELGSRAPQIALALLAARQSPEALAAFQGGIRQRQQEEEARARQTQLDEERRAAAAAQETRAQAAERRAGAAEQRAGEAAARAGVSAERQAVMNALGLLDTFGQQQAETATDPVAAENALLGRASSLEGLLKITPGQLAGMVPNMGPVVARGVRADAARLLEDTEARIRKTNKDATIDDTTATFQWETVPPRVQRALVERGHPDGQPVKPSQLSALAARPTVTVPKPSPTPGTFEDYLAAPPERRADIEAARKRYQQADDRPQQVVPIVIQGPNGPVVVDRGSRTAQPVLDASGQPLAPAPTADMRNKQAARKLVATSIQAVQQLSTRILTRVGPGQRAAAIKRGAEAVFGNDPEFRTYQDARMALAGNLAVGQQGSRPSDADIRAIWLPLVPDPYRDTADSAAMKWELIRTMSNAPVEGAPAQEVVPRKNPFRP